MSDHLLQADNTSHILRSGGGNFVLLAALADTDICSNALVSDAPIHVALVADAIA